MNFNRDVDFFPEIKAALERVVDSGRLINGPELEKFERQWAHYNHARYAIGVGSGTDALRLALTALGVGPGDEVITPAFNAAYAAQAVTAIGATNVYVDVCPGTLLIDPAKIAAAITPRTRAIIPVHLYGQMVDMPNIQALAEWHGLVVVEDAAQAHGALYNGSCPGKRSDAACYSHYPTKNLGCLGEGGSVTTRLPIVAQRIRLLRDAGRTDRYVHALPGLNSMLDEIQAAVLNVKLPKLNKQNARRSTLADRYRRLLGGVGDIRFQTIVLNAQTVNHLFPIRTERRVDLMKHLTDAGIPTLSHYPCVMTRQPFAVADALDQGPFPHAEKAALEVMSLPLWPSMSEDEQDAVIRVVKEFFA